MLIFQITFFLHVFLKQWSSSYVLIKMVTTISFKGLKWVTLYLLEENVSFPGTQYHGTGFCQGQVHTVPYRTSARRARVLWNCMNESLAEPFLWFWVSGKGILWNYSIKLQNVKNADIMLSKNSWNQCNTNGHHQEVNNHLPPGGHHREINEKVKTIYLLVVFLSYQIT